MSGIRGKLIVDKQKFIIQVGGDSSNPVDFQENEMNLIAIGPGHRKVEAVFKDSTGSRIFDILFADKIEISRNMLDQNLSINIDDCGEIPLDSQTVSQFGLLVSSQHGIQAVRDWSQI